MRPLPAVTLRPAARDDIAFLMSTERLPGYEWFVGQWNADKHAEVMTSANSAVLVGLDASGTPQGFAVLRELDNPEGNIYLQRIAITQPGSGFGRALLHAVTGWAFETLPSAHRFWLLVKIANTRAQHVYREAGFTEEGRLRQAHIEPDGARGDSFMFSKLRPEWSCAAASATT